MSNFLLFEFDWRLVPHLAVALAIGPAFALFRKFRQEGLRGWTITLGVIVGVFVWLFGLFWMTFDGARIAGLVTPLSALLGSVCWRGATKGRRWIAARFTVALVLTTFFPLGLLIQAFVFLDGERQDLAVYEVRNGLYDAVVVSVEGFHREVVLRPSTLSISTILDFPERTIARSEYRPTIKRLEWLDANHLAVFLPDNGHISLRTAPRGVRLEVRRTKAEAAKP